MHASPDDRVTYIGITNGRRRVRFGIRQRDRLSHFYVIGKTGTGKSTLLLNMAVQDLIAGQGFALLDPHGDLVSQLRDRVPPEREQNVIYLDVPNRGLDWHFNPFAGVSREARSLAAAGLVETFKKLWPDDWGPRLEHLLRNVVYTLLETPGSNLGDIPALLADKEYRKEVVEDLENDVVRAFWKQEYDRYSPGFRSVVIAPLQNKIGALLTDPILRRIFVGPGRTFRLRQLMDSGKVLLVNLDKGRLGEGPSAVLGSLLVSQIALAALSRSNVAEHDRRDFFLYLDEFQSFTTRSTAGMLSELRKYHVGMLLANQHLSQIDPAILTSVLGNVGSLMSFRVGADDAVRWAREFAPVFDAKDLVGLPRYNMYARLLVDATTTRAFSGITLPTVSISSASSRVAGHTPFAEP